VPGTDAVAFNCAALNAVPGTIIAGMAHVITGVAWFTTIVAVLVAAA
jgi:hypothetical protein